MKNFALLFLLCGLAACTEKTTETTDRKPATNLADNLRTAAGADPVTIDDLDFETCRLPAVTDSGCSCDWRPVRDDYKRTVFSTDVGENACVTLDGTLLQLKGGQTDDRFDRYRQTFEKNWIVFNEKGPTTLFGEPITLDDYEATREQLVQYLLLMDDLPEAIPMTMNGTVGMGTRGEYRSMAQEAVEIAKKRRATGDYGMPVEYVYQNDTYKVVISAKVDGKNDSGGDTFAGTMRVENKEGIVLATQEVFGGCDC